MSAGVFVDTNVLVYARDHAEPEKQPRAAAWLAHLWRRRTGRISVQVLQEFYATVTGKLRPGMPADVARRYVRTLLAWSPVAADGALLERAWRVKDRYRLSWWDSLIVAAAQAADCGSLLSEDLQEGQDFDGVVVVNPFTTPPPDDEA